MDTLKKQNVLRWFTDKEDLDSVRDLIKNGVSFVQPDEFGKTAIQMAIRSRNRHILQLMTDAYDLTRVNPRISYHVLPLKAALIIDNISFVVRWAKQVSLNTPDEFGFTSLHIAARYMNHKSALPILLFIKYGADASARTIKGSTPLHLVVESVSAEMNVKLYPKVMKKVMCALIKGGGDIDAQDNNGRTPLHLSCTVDDQNCLLELIQLGANFLIENREGYTFIDKVFFFFRDLGLLSSRREWEANIFEEKMYQSLRTMMHHVLKMEVIGFEFSEQLKYRINRLYKWIEFLQASGVAETLINTNYVKNNQSLDDIPTFTTKCESECEKLKKMKVGFVSMYDIIRKNDSEMGMLTMKPSFREYFYSGTYKEDFPLYYYFLEKQFRVGVLRNILLPRAKRALKFIHSGLPENVILSILTYFSNEELIEFVENMFDINPEVCPSGEPLSKIILRENTFDPEL